MKKIFTSLFFSLIAVVAMATNYQYYVGPSAVTVTKNSSKDNYKYTVTITQEARNINMGASGVYSTTTTLVLMPLKDKLEGVYTSDVANKDNVNWISSNSGNQSYVKSGDDTRYLNTDKVSTFTIAKLDQNTYYIVSGSIYVTNGTHTYEYHFCYDKDELTNPVEKISKKPFKFTPPFITGYKYNYDMYDISNMVVSENTVDFNCTGKRAETSDAPYDYSVHLVFPSSDINGEYSTISQDPSRRLQNTSYVKWGTTKRPLGDEYVSSLTVVQDGEGNITIVDGTILGYVASVDDEFLSPRRYHFSEIVTIDENKRNNEKLLQNCANFGTSLDQIQLVRSMVLGTYNTFCAPFAMTQTEIEHAFGDGADVRALESSSYDAEKNEFTLNFSTSSKTSMEAGKPYLVKPTYVNDENPIYYYDIDPSKYATEAQTVSTGVVDFVGVLSPFTLAADDETILFLASGNELKYSKAGTMKGMRGYFQLKQAAPAGARARIVMEKETTTGVENVSSEKKYGEPTKRLVNGQLVIIRDGKMYNVQGVQL